MVDGSRSDLDGALTNLSSAVVDVQRFIAGSRNQTAEQLQRLSNVTKNLADNKLVVENLLHVAPNAIGNAYNIYNPDTRAPWADSRLANFSNPIAGRSARRSVPSRTPPRPKPASCARSTSGPALRLLNFNYLPFPFNAYLGKSAEPGQADLLRPQPGARWLRCQPGACGDPAGRLGVHRIQRRRAATGRLGRSRRRTSTGRTHRTVCRPIRPRRCSRAHRSRPGVAVGSGRRRRRRPAGHAAARRGAAATAARRRDTAIMIGRGSVQPAGGDRDMRRGQRQRLCLRGPELAAAAGHRRPRHGLDHLPRRDRQCRPAGIEFAGDDRRRRRRQRRQDDGAATGTPTSRCR